jgi:hypothetical protein
MTVQTLSPKRYYSQFLSSLSPALREVMPRAAVYGHLVHNCFSLREDTARAIEKDWQLSTAEIDRLAIRSCPSHVGNLLASASCLKRFGRDALSQVPGFYGFTREDSPCNCLEWRDDCVCHLESWQLDIDPRLADRAFILPIRYRKYPLLIEALRIFRHTHDERGFLLRLRTEERKVA